MTEQSYRELTEERGYWRRLLGRAQERGQTGETFARCLAQVDALIAERDADAAREEQSG